MVHSPREKKQRRRIWTAITIQAVAAVTVKWLTTVLVRKLFEYVLEVQGAGQQTSFAPNSAFWDAVFLEALDFYQVFAVAVAVGAVSAICRSVQYTLQESWANERARGFRRLIVRRSLAESVLGQGNSVAAESSFLLQEIEAIRAFESVAFFERKGDVMVMITAAAAGLLFNAELTAIALGTLVVLLLVPHILSNFVLAESDSQLSTLLRQVYRLTSDIVRTGDVIAVSCMDDFELHKLDKLEDSAGPIEAFRQRWTMGLRTFDQTFFYSLQPFLVFVAFLWIRGIESFDDAIQEVFAIFLVLMVMDGANEAFINLKSSEREALRYRKSLVGLRAWIGDAPERRPRASDSMFETFSEDQDHPGSGPSKGMSSVISDSANDSKALEDSVEGDIVVRDLQISFNDDFPITYPREIRFRYRESTALTGDSGSGKSSLVKCMAGLVEPSRGTIHFGDARLRPFTFNAIRQYIAMVSQDSLLFARTIKENVWYGNDENDPHMRDKVCLALHQVGLLDWVNTLEGGIEHSLDLKENQVSGGQAQRLQIARLLCKDPAVVLLDEPLSALDGHNRSVILSQMKEFLRGRTTVWITHNDEVARKFCKNHIHLTQEVQRDRKSTREGLNALWPWRKRESSGSATDSDLDGDDDNDDNDESTFEQTVVVVRNHPGPVEFIGETTQEADETEDPTTFYRRPPASASANSSSFVADAVSDLWGIFRSSLQQWNPIALDDEETTQVLNVSRR
ncbi:ABC transporter B family member 2 (ABC transporter ABCB.2) [Durusdinium trenchii]|uniref:ABC transporter B family member 2 (ABC transporter ABCB.2) n=1 Tax=Durusdinium trenchii TaxID=1381693 RepID=A0ABP0LXU0_9DINO